MTKRISMLTLKAAASAAVLALAPFGAEAAECFDRDTNDPKAGNATAVVGPAVDVERLNRENAFRPSSGADMFTGDTVRTGDASHLQLKLCDWSTYTFSPNSESAINEFFDAQGAGRRRVINFFRGGFRFSSGRDTEPGSTEVEIQESGVTMGVRGTNVILVELDGYVYALLEGPVRDNSGLAPKGLVEFWTDGNREAIEAVLKRSGFAVRIGPDGVSEPFRADDELLRRIYEAFVPVIPESEGSAFDYAGDPLNNSGQGAQEGDDERRYAENKNEKNDEDTENKPEQPSVGDDDAPPPPPPPPPPPVTIPVGDILPLDVLDDFADAQTNNPDGVLFAVAPAQIDNGTSIEDGVVIFQIHVDWASRTIAPEALASFARFDGTVTDPDDLTQRNFSGFTGGGAAFEDGYLNALFDSAGVPFSAGDNDLAVYMTPTYNLTIRQGENDTVTADVSIDYSDVDAQNNNIALTGGADDLMFTPGEGDLAYFTTPLGFALSITELDGLSGAGTTLVTGFSTNVISTLGTPTPLTGVSYVQLEIDFDNRTVGGGSSFLAVSAAADAAIGGENTVQYVALDQAASFDSGLFGLAFHTLASISSDPNALKGQAIIGDGDGLEADIAAIVSDDAGNHLYTEVGAFQDSGVPPLSTIAELEALAGSLGAGTYHFDGTAAGRGFAGYAAIERANGTFSSGDAEAEIDINFANRTVGGGESYVSVAIDDTFNNFNLDIFENLSAVSFDDAAGGQGVFGFGADDFSGTNIENALFLIRDGNGGAGENADIYFNFNDGAGGEGTGQIELMPRVPGATPPPL
ncbi:FecR domain-containing protein [Hyphococcus luteus]|uniref:FecR protein domain-containing protein n=1 Tax=Hyphococcus luteus TaxID=2058213 RepID=A0A2S7K2W6_9PROT|nr:FecR domain-containing protein [Marinicaulis flavus]PQA86849.1 hypothetical protein CW354_15330 [Marinicaulis flavus]